MRVKISPSKISGKMTAPPSKSMAHRLLVCAALSGGASTVKNVAPSEDILATLDCISALGANVEKIGETVKIGGIGGKPVAPRVKLFCRESGSTLRFLIPVALSLGCGATFFGSEKLFSRPLEFYEEMCRERGLDFSKDKNTLTVGGKLSSGEFTVPGDVSSQFVSGLLFALPTLSGDSKITLVGNIESRPYIDMTISALEKFGVLAEWRRENEIFVRGGQTFKSADVTVEGDCSNAAFFEALNFVGGSVTVGGIDENTVQGDKIYGEYFKKLCGGTPELSLADCPDLGPAAFALAAELSGATFTHTRRLRQKESDRIASMSEELEKFGAELDISEDTVTVKKTALHAPEKPLSSHNDHRVAMALSVLMTKYGGELSGAEAVKKSMPDFYDVLKSLGAEVEFYDR